MTPRDLTDAEIITQLRKAGAVWFRNSDLLLLEELIARLQQAREAWTQSGEVVDEK